MKKLFLLSLLNFIGPTIVHADISFTIQSIPGYFYTTTEISCIKQRKKVGMIHIMQFFSCAILHTLFIKPAQRNKGYGTLLLHYACNYVTSQDVQWIFIQPGPFDIASTGFESILSEQRQKKIDKLVILYKKVGFNIAPSWLRHCANFFYKISGITEDASYLMIRSSTS